jgi:fructosamine-3-kinase
MRQYLSIVLEVKHSKLNPVFEGYKLFKDYDLSHTTTNDWNDFLRNYLIEKQKEVKNYLSKDVVNYEYKYAKLIELLSNAYRGDYSLIHGDFYPANLLVNENGVINAVIDFGMMTMYGDYLFDVALSWTLFDLYDELGAKLDRYLNLIITKLGEEVRSKIYLYALYYAIYSANFYSTDCSDGHYGWSVRILNNEMYWNGLE